MSRLYEEVKKRLTVIENMYDIIRIVDPNNKKILSVKEEKVDMLEGSCYDYWKRGIACSKCVSNIAYLQDAAYAKIEKMLNNYSIVVALPITINNKRYVLEMLKGIEKNKDIFSSESIIANKKDEIIIRDELIDLFNTVYKENLKNFNISEDDYYIEISDEKIIMLEKKIDELRYTLNELCSKEIDMGNDAEILKTSEDLDKLIVDYMNLIKR
jgi:hypothetical protein